MYSLHASKITRSGEPGGAVRRDADRVEPRLVDLPGEVAGVPPARRLPRGASRC